MTGGPSPHRPLITAADLRAGAARIDRVAPGWAARMRQEADLMDAGLGPDGQPLTPWADPWHDVGADFRDAIRRIEDDSGRFLIAPPGTPVDGPGWHEPPPGTVLSWGINGERPSVAVKRGGVLLSDGGYAIAGDE